MVPNTIHASRLLIVSSESSLRRLLDSIAQSNDWEVQTSSSSWAAFEQLQSKVAPQLLLLDIPSGDSDGLQFLSWLRKLRPEIPIVAICDRNDGVSRSEAIRLGVKEILLRPFAEPQLETSIREFLHSLNEIARAEMTSEDIESLGEDEFFLSVSPAMRQLRAQAELLAHADVPVLILGEPGSGKGTVARLIHQRSLHSGFEFLRVNCAEMPADLLEIELFGREEGRANGLAKPSGKLETGQRGTILLDEITEMPLILQSRILRVLQERRFLRSSDANPMDVSVRILATSSNQINRALAENRLHPDLYYRLSAFTLHLPALRDRKEEIEILLRYSMHKIAKRYGLPPRDFSAAVLETCKDRTWPGNLKELETFVKRYLIAGDDEPLLRELTNSDAIRQWPKVTPSSNAHPEGSARQNGSSPQSLKSMVQSVRWETERNAIAAALEKTGWNRKAASRLLGVSYRTILSKIEQFEMSAPNSFLSRSELTLRVREKETEKRVESRNHHYGRGL